MAITIQQLLQHHQLSIDELAKSTGINKEVLQGTLQQPVATWTVDFLNKMAAALAQTPSHLLAQLQDESFTLTIDPQQQTIQGVEFKDPQLFAQIQSAVKISCMEGWHPTAVDIVDLLNVGTHPQPQLEQEFEQVFGD